MLFLAYALIQIVIWSCCTIAAIHFEKVSILFIALLSMIFMPEFKRTKDTDKKSDPLDIKKG